jgi:hypothetical protein
LALGAAARQISGSCNVLAAEEACLPTTAATIAQSLTLTPKWLRIRDNEYGHQDNRQNKENINNDMEVYAEAHGGAKSEQKPV